MKGLFGQCKGKSSKNIFYFCHFSLYTGPVRGYTYCMVNLQVYYVVSGSGKTVDIGPVVHSLADAIQVVWREDEMWAAGHGRSDYEGCDVYCRDLDSGKIWMNDEDDWIDCDEL